MARCSQRNMRTAGTKMRVSWLFTLSTILYNLQVALGACGDSINPVLQACTDSSIATLSSVSTSAVFIDMARIATPASVPCTCHVELLGAADEAVFVLANLESSTVTAGSSCTSYAEQDGQCGTKDFGCLADANTWSEFLLERPIKPSTTFNFMPDTASDLCIKYTVQRASGNVKMWCVSTLTGTTTEAATNATTTSTAASPATNNTDTATTTSTATSPATSNTDTATTAASTTTPAATTAATTQSTTEAVTTTPVPMTTASTTTSSTSTTTTTTPTTTTVKSGGTRKC